MPNTIPKNTTISIDSHCVDQTSTMTHPEAKEIQFYRPDLDGLRAIAIVLVMLEHLFSGFRWIGKGFCGGLGVDIFFVLSGYLITSIISRALAQGTFQFRDFYARRIRRLFPTLIVTFVLSFLIGWMILQTYPFRLLGATIATSGISGINFFLSSGTPFFHINPKLLPFGQLWSLALEEQFYLIFPWIIVGMTRFSLFRKWRIPFLILVICLSWTYWYNFRDVWGETYYNPLARSWELCMGVMLALCWAHVETWKRSIGLLCQKIWNSPWGIRPVLTTIGLILIASEMESHVGIIALGTMLVGLARWLSYSVQKNEHSCMHNADALSGFTIPSVKSIDDIAIDSSVSGKSFVPKKSTEDSAILSTSAYSEKHYSPQDLLKNLNAPYSAPLAETAHQSEHQINTIVHGIGVYCVVTALILSMTVPLCVAAILATLGTVLLISAGPNVWISQRILAHPMMIYIGRISYALYVIHYPLYVMWGFKAGHIIEDPGVLTGIFILSFPLAAAMYHFVEKPMRHAQHLWCWIIAMALCVGIGYAGYAEMIAPRNIIEHVF